MSSSSAWPSGGGRSGALLSALPRLALGLVLLPNLAFPESGQFPFAFSSYMAIPLWCGGALFVTRGLGREERQLRWALVGYVACRDAAAAWRRTRSAATRCASGALFGGPVLAAVVLARRPRLGAFSTLILVLAMAGGLYWQVTASVSQIARSVGDPSTSPELLPAARPSWLRAHGGSSVRVEVPPTANHWESAYLATQFELARGWLRQLDTTRDDIFYDDDGEHLSSASYQHWLHRNAISYVALPDAPLDYSSVAERRLILSAPPYLDLRWTSPHWRIYAVRDPQPLVEPIGAAAAHTLWVGRQSFGLRVTHPGDFLVRVNFTPYWSISRGSGCLLRHGEWTVARAAHPGILRVSADFSLGRAWNAVTGARKTC